LNVTTFESNTELSSLAPPPISNLISAHSLLSRNTSHPLYHQPLWNLSSTTVRYYVPKWYTRHSPTNSPR